MRVGGGTIIKVKFFSYSFLYLLALGQSERKRRIEAEKKIKERGGEERIRGSEGESGP